MRVERELRVVRPHARVEPPVHDRERVVQRAGDDNALAAPLVLRADVDEHRPARGRLVRLLRRETAKALPGLREHVVDRPPARHGASLVPALEDRPEGNWTTWPGSAPGVGAGSGV